jgi:hypothetical protein
MAGPGRGLLGASVRESAMSCGEWVVGPFGLNNSAGGTLECQRTILVVVHHLTAASRLADIVPWLESDRRVQVVFTWAPGALAPVMPAGVREFLRRLDGVVLPWQQATQVRFDLAIAAARPSLERLHAPVLTVSHGIGYGKYAVGWAGPGPQAAREVFGLERSTLVHRGRVVAAAIAVPTQRMLERLARACPEAAPVAFVAGDPCFDRLVASAGSRDAYRRALGVGDRTLVAVSSTWGPGSLLQRHPDVLSWLTAELPAQDYKVAAIIHPGVWSWHGRRQVQAWYADAVDRGLLLVPPEEGWRGVLAAADVLVGDHGSVTAYAAAIGIPVLMAASSAKQVEPGSLQAGVAAHAPMLCPAQPCAPQLGIAVGRWRASAHAAIREQVSDVPGRSAQILRGAMYRLMNLAEPADPPPVRPVPVPEPLEIGSRFGRAR